MTKPAVKSPAILLFEDGKVVYGHSIGSKGTTIGEICFNTGMTGYQEIYTDPSYFGQIIINTVAHVGNYGTHVAEVESDKVQFSGLVCDQFSAIASRHDKQGNLQAYLEQANIVGIANVDTRSLVRHVRINGAQNAIISSEDFDLESLKARLAAHPSMASRELSSEVTTTKNYDLGSGQYRVAVLDYGVKQSILTNMASRDMTLRVFTAKTGIDELLAWQPDGFFLSNGPGDPAAMSYAVDTVKQMLATGKPLFGICLGHQLLAEAVGISTYKMHHGHRGLNHPVKNLITGRGEITSQNHGFSVDATSVAQNSQVEVTHVNLNDHTIEGLRLTNGQAFSVQYHPEASPGPHDSRYLFGQFSEKLATAR